MSAKPKLVEVLTDAPNGVVQVMAESMPSDPRKKALTVRVWPGQYKAWSDAARADRDNLARWVQRQCDAAAIKAGFTIPPAPKSNPRGRPRKTR